MRRTLILFALAASGACGVQVESGTRDAGGDASPPPSDASIDAPPDARACAGGDAAMTSSDGSCFLLFTTPRSFADARAACVAIDADLAITNTAERYATAKALAGANDAFIGLSDEAIEGTFRWVDNTSMLFMAWDPMEPNDGASTYPEDCILIAGARGGDWDDRPCAPGGTVPVGAGLYSYLCQF